MISKNVPTLVEGFFNVSLAQIERYHLLVLDTNGTVYGSGLNGVSIDYWFLIHFKSGVNWV